MNFLFIPSDKVVCIDGRTIIGNYVIPNVFKGKLHAVVYSDEEKQYQTTIDNIFTNINLLESDFSEYIAPLVEQWEDLKLIEDTPIVYTLEELKLAKKTELNKLRDEKETAGFIYNDRPFDSDMTSYNRLVGAHLSAQTALAMGGEFTPIPWTLQDNTTMLMTATDFLQIIPTFAGYSGMLHAKCNELKALVDEATTKEQLDLIVWE